jgi:hypothetical protein
MLNELTHDWKKRASAVVDDVEVEKQFRDLAYGFVQNKARVLMEAPYRIGFEIVYKNDDNSRMVGIFAFRVGDRLLYAPVFFYEGEVKGADLLYCHDEKMFKPLTPEWIKYIISEAESVEGKGIDRGEFNKVRDDVNMQGIFTPNNTKKASETELDQEKVASFINEAVNYIYNPSSMEDICESLEDLRKQSTKNFQEFISKHAGVSALNLIAKTVEEDFEFANNLYKSMDQSVYLPEHIESREKSASAPHKVSLHLGGWHSGIKSASEDFYKKGYSLEDTRDDVYVSKTVEFEELCISELSDAGVYELFQKNGDKIKVFAAPVFDPYSDDYWEHDESGYAGEFRHGTLGSSGESDSQKLVIIDIKGKKCDTMYGPKIVGEFLEEETEDFDFKDKVSSGKSYMMFDVKSKVFIGCDPIKVTKTKSNGDGIIEITCTKGYSREKVLYKNDNIVHKLTEDDCDVLGENVKFIEVKNQYSDSEYLDIDAEREPSLASTLSTNIEQVIFNSGVIKGAAIKKANDPTDSYQIRTDDNSLSDSVSKYSMLQFLTTGLHIKGASAEALIESADKNGKVSFGFILPERVKEAATAITLMEDPRFTRSTDPRFGVEVEHPQEFLLDTQSNAPQEYEPPVGFEEDWDPEQNRDKLMTATPNELYQMSQTMQIPNLFEHGAVGELVKSYDSGSIIDQYIPTLEEALDHLGRILFLVNWKPKDFKSNYGSDDFTQKKNEILSNFKSFGELVLDLKKRSRLRSEGNAFMV